MEEQFEEEFFHTFNKLQELGKQIIMISDRYPKDIKKSFQKDGIKVSVGSFSGNAAAGL